MAIADTPATDLERRKMVRLRLRCDLSITPQKYEGRTYYVVKDPVSLRYYRFKEQEYFLIQLMNGEHTLDEAQKEFEKRFRPERLTLEDLEQFGQQLLTAGLVQNESPMAGKQLFDRRKKRRRMELLQKFTNILYIKIPVFDPDRLLVRMVPYFRWMFTVWFFFFSMAFFASAILLVLTHFETFLSRLPSYQEFFSFKTVVYLWAALGVVKVIHEFGHGLSCKVFGGEVHEMGFLFLCLSPAMYCNVSDAWTMPSKWRRIIISFAGIYVELMIAAIATFVWWNSPGHPFINNLALSLMIVCSVSTVVFNGNPLMRYDGYYVLSDWLEIPNLRERANRYISRLAMEYGLGIETLPEPYMERWRRILFISYAVLSWVYRWVVTFVILSFLSSFLKPYKLQIISQMLTAVAVGSMFGWPLFRMIRNINKRGRLPDMKTKNVMVTGTIIGALLLAFFFLPLPVTRVREPGMIQIQPRYQTPHYVEQPGILEKLHVEEGMRVTKGQLLAELRNIDFELRKKRAETEIGIQNDQIGIYESEIGRLNDRIETEKKKKAEMAAALIEARRRKGEAGQELINLNKAIASLTLRAQSDGVVINLPRKEEVGKTWEGGQSTPFCTIGNPEKLRITVAVTPANYDLLLDNIKKRGPKRPLEVTIRVQGHDAKTWKGRVVAEELTMAEEKRIPVAMATKGGGPLAAQESGDPNYMTPIGQVYFVYVDFLEPDPAICPGMRAQVKIHNDYRSAAWGIWRWLSGAFDLGLAF